MVMSSIRSLMVGMTCSIDCACDNRDSIDVWLSRTNISVPEVDAVNELICSCTVTAKGLMAKV